MNSSLQKWAKISRGLANSKAPDRIVARAIARHLADPETTLTTRDIKRMAEIYKNQRKEKRNV